MVVRRLMLIKLFWKGKISCSRFCVVSGGLVPHRQTYQFSEHLGLSWGSFK